MADYTFLNDEAGAPLYTVLCMLNVNTGMIMAVSVDEKGPLDYAISSVVETTVSLHQWGCKKTGQGKAQGRNCTGAEAEILESIAGAGGE
eukprot:6028633-Amphidinium_carterae.2